ncbi:MAG: GLUG motif-containing protein [Lachnospiraceae bacterium]
MLKKRLLALCLGLSMICTSIMVPMDAKAETTQAGETQEETAEQGLTPADLNFRKFYTGRNLFDSEIPIQALDLESVAAGAAGAAYENGKLKFSNNTTEKVSNRIELGAMKPYSVVDMTVTEQNAAKGYATAEIHWDKDENNSISVRKNSVSAKQEEEDQAETVISSLDMNMTQETLSGMVYPDMNPSNDVIKVDGGIQFQAKGTKGECYVPVGTMQQNTVLEAEISEQKKYGYSASSILKLRDKTADNTKTNGIYLTQKADGSMMMECFKNGSKVGGTSISTSASLGYPCKMRLVVSGKYIIASRIVNGVEDGVTKVDVSQWFDFTDESVLANFEGTVGAKLMNNTAGVETLTYSSAAIKTYHPEEPDVAPTSDDGYVLTVIKDGEEVVNKTIAYPAGLDITEPYTLRAHWAGRYLSLWIVKDGKPYLMSTEELSKQFDMRRKSVYETFKTSLGTELTAGASLTISEFRNYYSGGDGQADPKPLQYTDGTVMVEDGKMWVSMTLRGYQPLPASCQGIYSLDLKTNELKLVNITTFTRPEENYDLEWAFHASAFCCDKETGKWYVVTSSHDSDKALRAGSFDEDPRKTPYLAVKVDSLSYKTNENGEVIGKDGKVRSRYEDPSLIYNEELGKWSIAACTEGYGGFGVSLIMADSFMGPYEEVGVYGIASCTGILQQKVDGKYYVFTGRSPGGKDNGDPGKMNLEALNYPEMTKHCSLSIDGETNSANPWPMLYPTVNDKGETVYRLLTFDRDTIIKNDGTMASGQYSYGRIYLYEALEKGNSQDVIPTKPEITGENVATITTAEELLAINKDLTGVYKLGADIDLTGKEWYPIGTQEEPFSGTLDGAGHTITGLTASQTEGMEGVGLFGYTSVEADLSNIKIADSNVKGRIYTGSLVGYNDGYVYGCEVTNGNVTGESETGLLIGRNAGTVKKCSSSGKVTGIGNDSTGGLVGTNHRGMIEGCSSTATVEGTINVGGLVGYNDRGFVRNTYAAGKVTGLNYVGGLVGASSSYAWDRNDPTFQDCYVQNSYANSEVTGSTAGTLVGFNDKDIVNSFGMGTVTGGEGSFAVGGLVGRNNQYGKVTNSYTNGTVTGSDYVGNLFGKNVGEFTNTACSAGAAGSVAIGNSRDTIVSNEVPDFTAAATYAADKLGWSTDIWEISDGKLPTLRADYTYPDEDAGPAAGEEILSNGGFEGYNNWEEHDGTTFAWDILQNTVETIPYLCRTELRQHRVRYRIFQEK